MLVLIHLKLAQYVLVDLPFDRVVTKIFIKSYLFEK